MDCTTSLQNTADVRSGLLRMPVYIGILILLCGLVSAVHAETSADDSYYSGISYYEDGNYRAAITAFLNEIATDSESAEIWNYLGLAYLEEQEYSEASSSFKRAVALNPQYIEAWNNLGKSYDLLDRPDDAQLAYLMAEALSADDSTGNSYDDSHDTIQPPSDPGRKEPPLGVSPQIPSYEPRGPWVPGFSLINY